MPQDCDTLALDYNYAYLDEQTKRMIRRTLLKKRNVTMLNGVQYVKIDDAGLHLTVDGVPQVLAVDTIVVFAGQEPRRDLVAGLQRLQVPHTLVGGADVAADYGLEESNGDLNGVLIGLDVPVQITDWFGFHVMVQQSIALDVLDDLEVDDETVLTGGVTFSF